MFRRKKSQESSQQQPQAPSAPTMSGGYQVTEVPTYDKGKRRIVVYRSDASGRIIKSFKR